jgi:hypothetical protein
MRYQFTIKRFFLFIPSVFLLLSLLAIGCSNFSNNSTMSIIAPTLPPEWTATHSPTILSPTKTCTITPWPSPTATISQNQSSESELYPDGPWLSYINHSDNIVIVNYDGSGRSIIPYEIYKYMNAPYDSSSSLPLIAAISTDDSFDNVPVLLLINLPSLEIIQEIHLHSCPSNIPGCVVDDMAVVYFQPKWSPNGRYLAFLGAIEGSSTDVYLYDGINNTIRRLTSGSNQVGDFFWSPDSRWIVHEEVSNFSGWVVEAVWAASSVHDEVRWLYSPASKQGQILLGWLDDDLYVVYDHGMEGESNLRLISIKSGTVSKLFPGLFFETFMDPESGTIAIIPIEGAPYNDNYETGIYLISVRNTTPRRVDIDDINIDGWNAEVGYFLMSTYCPDNSDRLLGFTPDGTVECVSISYASTSPDDQWTVTYEGEIQLLDSNDNLIRTFEGLGYGAVIWRPDSEGFFVNTRNLYYIDLFEFDVVQIDEDGSNTQFMWFGK